MMYAHHIAVIRRLIRAGGVHRAEKVLEKVPPRDLPQVLSALEHTEARILATRLVTPTRVQRSFREMPLEARQALLAALDNEQILRLLERIPPGPAAAVLGALPPERAHILEGGAPQRAAPGRGAADVMGPVPLALKRETLAQGAIDAIRESPSRGYIFYLYVVDEGERLAGVVPLRRLVTAEATTSLGDLMTPRPIFVTAGASAEDAARLIGDHGLLALPVLNEDRTLAGLIKTDDVFELLAGAEGSVAQEPEAPAPAAPRSNAPGGSTWAQWFPFWSSKRPRGGRTPKAALVGVALLTLGGSALSLIG